MTCNARILYQSSNQSIKTRLLTQQRKSRVNQRHNDVRNNDDENSSVFKDTQRPILPQTYEHLSFLTVISLSHTQWNRQMQLHSWSACLVLVLAYRCPKMPTTSRKTCSKLTPTADAVIEQRQYSPVILLDATDRASYHYQQMHQLQRWVSRASGSAALRNVSLSSRLYQTRTAGICYKPSVCCRYLGDEWRRILSAQRPTAQSPVPQTDRTVRRSNADDNSRACSPWSHRRLMKHPRKANDRRPPAHPAGLAHSIAGIQSALGSASERYPVAHCANFKRIKRPRADRPEQQ